MWNSDWHQLAEGREAGGGGGIEPKKQERERKFLDVYNSVVIAGVVAVKVGGGGYWGISGDGKALDLKCWTHSTVYRSYVVELCTWNLCHFNQHCPKQI